MVSKLVTTPAGKGNQHLHTSFSQPGLAPAHGAKTTSNWIADHGVTALDWLASSSDMNPAENRWTIVKRRLRDTRPQQHTDVLKATIKATRASVTVLIASMQ